MIPITVSYFTDHGADTRRKAVGQAFVYALGIVLTFTALGMALALVFGASGVNRLAANPWVNLLITAIFLAFAFSLFGAFVIQAPPSLVNRLDSVTRHEGTSRSLGTLLMGLVFTLTSFTCTAPFIGTLLVMASQGNWRWPLIGMLVFSSVFAIPFFLFALMPQLLAQLPKSGSWLNSVKVVMGFLEIAAAMKFLSNADLIWHWGIFTRQVVLAIWVATGVLIVLYLLGKFQTIHDTSVPTLSAARLLLVLLFLSGSVWLGTGLFGHPLGEIEAYLPPPASTQPAGASNKAGAADASAPLSWILNDYSTAIGQAKQQNKPLFIDFTGYTCTNCRWMEANMFTQPAIKTGLEQFVRARLYTDGAGPVYANQQKMENDRFGTVALPLYAIVSPDEKTIATFPGLTRNPQQFLDFLNKR
jgi:thiol:disulfide interchange protein DsbD